MRCLEKDQARRYGSASEVADALHGWLESVSEFESGFSAALSHRPGLARPAARSIPSERRAASWWVDELRPWDFSGFLGIKRAGFCGREWMFDRIHAWGAGDGAEPALLITGDPGSGKSALVAELVHRNANGRVLAHHCCQWDTEATLEPGRFIRSLAAMTASKLDSYAAELDRPAVREALDESRCRDAPASALEEGVLLPLERMPPPDGGTHYIIIDALYEALGRAGSKSLVHLLSSRLDRFPKWLRVVATTRRDPEVLDRLRGLRAETLDADDSRNRDDVGRFIM
jgi:hypothetical protein